jgi:acetyl-CoA carboxylase alpha subunit
MALTLRKAIADQLKQLQEKPADKLVADRQKKLLELGKFREQAD